MHATTSQASADFLPANFPLEGRAWIEALAHRLGEPAANHLRRSAAPLVSQCGRSWGADLRLGCHAWENYERRVAGALAYHWWRYGESGFRKLSEVITLVRAGKLSFGTYKADIVRDVVLAEGFLQKDEGAAALFVTEYRPLIDAEARRIGPLAEQELDGFEAQLIMPRPARPRTPAGDLPATEDDLASLEPAAEELPPRLALYSGRTSLRDWLRTVIRNEFFSRVRPLTTVAPLTPTQQSGQVPPEGSVVDNDCVELLHPLFTRAVEQMEVDDAVLLRMVLLDSVPQVELARNEGVHKSTVSRRLAKVCETVYDQFRDEVKSVKQQKGGYEQCLEWLLVDSPDGRLTLASHLARAVRDRSG